jgi:hypothetical protein
VYFVLIALFVVGLASVGYMLAIAYGPEPSGGMMLIFFWPLVPPTIALGISSWAVRKRIERKLGPTAVLIGKVSTIALILSLIALAVFLVLTGL